VGLSEDIRDLLTTGGFSSSIFIAEAPERPANCLVVTATGGLGPTRTMSAGLANAPVEHVRMQVRARAADYAACDAIMTSAYGLLNGLQERTANARRYYYVSPVQTPFYLGLDGAARPVIAVNFDVQRAESTN
jgi:hypothetical protein